MTPPSACITCTIGSPTCCTPAHEQLLRNATKETTMATHRLDAGADTVHWGYFDAALKPLITVDPGDTVTISTVSGGPTQLPKADSGFDVPKALPAIHAALEPKLGGPHILTGPVAVRGARAGQVLEVRIKAIDL